MQDEPKYYKVSDMPEEFNVVIGIKEMWDACDRFWEKRGMKDPSTGTFNMSYQDKTKHYSEIGWHPEDHDNNPYYDNEDNGAPGIIGAHRRTLKAIYDV